MAQYHKIKEHDELVKDPKSGAILLKDRSVVDEYAARKNMLQSNRDLKTELNTLKAELEAIQLLKDDIAEIKELLARIVK